MFEYMDEKEQKLFTEVETDPLYQIDLSIRLLSVRETRMMRLITKYENGLTDKQRTVLQQMRKMKTLYRLQIKMV